VNGRGLGQHFLLTLRLNFRSGRAIAYGYLLPVIFLLGFGSIFRGGEPALLGQMGQILTITILGSCCLGMPTALVAERERGWWRRFQLLPVPVNALLGSVFLVRLVLVVSAVFLQLALARLVYGTPWPTQPVVFGVALLAVVWAFLGLGLVIVALARDVPAVQALGQCLFLPMILIGGVGVPLELLPGWAQGVAAFLPGRYAVEMLQSAYTPEATLATAGLALPALLVIGLAAGLGGLRLLPWEASAPWRGRGWRGLGVAGSAWVAVGVVSLGLGRVAPVNLSGQPAFAEITPAAVDTVSFSGLPDDTGFYAPLAPPLGDRRWPPRLEEFVPRLRAWTPGRRGDVGQQVRHLLSVAAIADITQDPSQAMIARAVFDHLRERFAGEELERALAWAALYPEAGRVTTAAPELGLRGEADAGIVRVRSGWYARKFLGRLRGAIPESP
jgi:hypothetical protein